MQDLKVTLIQTELEWETPDVNLDRFELLFEDVTDATDLILLPEMFTTGFTMNAEKFAEEMDGPTVKWLVDQANRNKCAIAGSMIIKEGHHFYNRFVWADAEGGFYHYDKRHLFRMAGEHQIYTAGKKNIIIEHHGWRIAPFVCYDLRFPVWTRNVYPQYDLALYIGNWPLKRYEHWKTLLRARAIENMAWVVGVNRIGKDSNGNNYNGDSSIYDPFGELVFHRSHEAVIHTEILSKAKLLEYRETFPVWEDADHFELQ